MADCLTLSTPWRNISIGDVGHWSTCPIATKLPQGRGNSEQGDNEIITNRQIDRGTLIVMQTVNIQTRGRDGPIDFIFHFFFIPEPMLNKSSTMELYLVEILFTRARPLR